MVTGRRELREHHGSCLPCSTCPLLAQALSDTEQLEILALLEAVSTERSAMRAGRALAELMRHVHDLGQRIAAELPDQDRDIKPARR
jgi:hypothetical protein